MPGGNGLDAREALPDAVAEVREHRATGLVVYRLDRLARDLILQETLLAEIANLGGRVFSTIPGEQDVIEDDPDDPSRRLIRQVLGAVLNAFSSAGWRARSRTRPGASRGSEPRPRDWCLSQGGQGCGAPQENLSELSARLAA